MSLTLQHTKECLCVAHIYALAGSAGINFDTDRAYDYGVDGTFRHVLVRDGRRTESGFTIDFQAKASVRWLERDGQIIYDLEAKNYNDIVTRDPSGATMILILLCLPKGSKEWHHAATDQTILKNACFWAKLKGSPTDNTARQRITIPTTNLLTPDTLKSLIENEKLARMAAYYG